MDQDEDPHLEARKAAYKAGPNGTRKREEAIFSLRKNKRAAAMMERRRAHGTLAPSHLDQGAVPNEWEQMMRNHYNKTALLAGDAQQLEVLAVLLDKASREQKERFLPTLLWNEEGTQPVVLRYLVSRACSNNHALKALLGATHDPTTHDITCTGVILEAGYLDLLAQALKDHAVRMPLDWHAAMWDLVANLSISTEAAQRVITQHPVMGKTYMVAAFHWANANHHRLLQNAMVHVLRCLVTADALFIPTLEYMQTTFVPLVAYIMNEVQAQNWREMDEPSLAALAYCAEAIRIYMSRVPNPQKEEILCPILNEVGIQRILSHLCAVCEAQTGRVHAALVALLGTFSIFRIPENPYHWAAYRVGVFRLLVQSTTRPGDESVRANAFTALANYVADDFAFVGPLVEAGMMTAMLTTLRHQEGARTPREQALYLLSNMFVVCDDTRRHNMAQSAAAEMTMKILVERERIINYIVPFIDSKELKPINDAIDILLVALQWNPALIMQTIAGDAAEKQIQRFMPTLKGNASTALFNKVVKIETLMERGHGKMDFEDMDQGDDDDDAIQTTLAKDEDVEMMDSVTTDGQPFFF